MKRKVLFTLFLLLPILAARGQVYPFDEIQLVFPDKFRLEYARELRVNDRHCKYYFTYGVCWVEAGYEESPFFCLVKEEDGYGNHGISVR